MKQAIKDAHYWIHNLSLSPHPEGGFFRETYRSKEIVPHAALPNRFSGERHFSTMIYYLLQQGDFSAFHRLKSDECWHFYGGGPLDLHILSENRHQMIIIGTEVADGEYLQYTVPAGAWFASEPHKGSSYSLVGCTVSPGFDFVDFEMANRRGLIEEFPKHRDLITRLTRES